MTDLTCGARKQEPFGVHLMIADRCARNRLLRAFRLAEAEVHVRERGRRYPAEKLAAF
jgi:hypothetical protein